MHLSLAEFFILGRIVAGLSVRPELLLKIKIGASLLRTIDIVFDEFGLQRGGPPEKWWDRQDDLPNDVVRRGCENAKRTTECMSTDEGFPGVPSAAMGLSRSEQGVLFVERTDGRICGWKIEPPKASLYMMLLRWLRPLGGQSPQVWLMLREAPWSDIVDEWASLTDVHLDLPHTPFMKDRPDEMPAILEAAAADAGAVEPFRMGVATGTVDYEQEAVAFSAGVQPSIWKTFRRWRQKADEEILGAFERALQILRSDAAIAARRCDLHVASLYQRAERELLDYCGEIDDLVLLMFAIVVANEWTHRASS